MSYPNQIFVSYAWKEESEALVDTLCEIFAEKGYQITRDKTAMRYKDSIQSFMDNIGRGCFIIAVVNDDYMKSEYCMYEAYRMFQSPDFAERVFPIVLPDADIFSFRGQAAYLRYWDQTYKELEAEYREIANSSPTMLGPLTERLRDIEATTRFINDFMDAVGDMNVLTSEMHKESNFSSLIHAIEDGMRKIDRKLPEIVSGDDEMKEDSASVTERRFANLPDENNVLRACLSNEHKDLLTGITEKAASLLDELIDYPIDHGPSHLFRVEEIVLDLVEVLMSRPASDGQYEITPLNNHECLMLLAAIQLHGIGLSLAARSNIRDMSKKHVGRITENAILGEGNWKDLNLGIPYDYREGIALVSTGGCSVGVLGSTYTSRCIAYNTNIRSSLLAALLRVADALDASQVRIKTSAADIASNLHLNWQGLLPYEYVSGIGYANKRVKFSFRLPRDDFDSYTEVLPDAILDFHQKRWGVLSRALSVYEVNIVLPMDKNDHKVIKSRAKKIPANLFDKIRLEGIENEEGPL